MQYMLTRLSAGTKSTLEQGAFLYALIELLAERGLISIEELDARKQQTGERLAEQFTRKGIGIALQDPEYDKYTFEGEAKIDCASRLEYCKAACCRLPFALSSQDVREGIVRWELGQPYIIAQGGDGYCVHMERSTCGCTVRENRPVPCRAYDCRKDNRIWLDFERKIVNPAIHEPAWPRETAGA
jgi:hypothetical protein